jgi:hypothetical protein
MQKSTTFTTIFRVKKCHFHYDMQKTKLKGLFNHSLGIIIIISLCFLSKTCAGLRFSSLDQAFNDVFLKNENYFIN